MRYFKVMRLLTFAHQAFVICVVLCFYSAPEARAQKVFTWGPSHTESHVWLQGYLPSINSGHSFLFEFGADSLHLQSATEEQFFTTDSTNLYVHASIRKDTLSAGKYYYRLILKTDNASFYAPTKAFDIEVPAVPEVSTLDFAVPGSIEEYRAPTITVNGIVNPNNLPTKYYFEYGKTTAYGQKSPTQDVAPKLSAYLIEKWNDPWLNNWYSWGNVFAMDDDPSGDGYAQALVPALVDLNHAAEGSVGPISLLMYTYHSGVNFFGEQSFRLGGKRADLRDARVSVRFRTPDFDHKNTDLSFWIQAQPHNEVWSPDIPASNWALTSLSMTDYKTTDWVTADFTLDNDANKWKNAGTNFDATDPWRFSYESLNDALGNVNMDFIFVALNVNPKDPPQGTIDFDEMRMRYRNYSVLSEGNGTSLIAWPADSPSDPFTLTDGIRTEPVNTWRSNSDPISPQKFVYQFKGPVQMTAVQIHQNCDFPSGRVAISSSEDGLLFSNIDTLTLPAPYHRHDNTAFTYHALERPITAKYLQIQIIEGLNAGAWGLGEIEVFGAGASYGTGNEPMGVNADLSQLELGQLYHYRLVAENQLGLKYGEDKTFIIEHNPIVFTSPDTFFLNGFESTLRVKAGWTAFENESERIRYKAHEKPAWLLLDENEGLLSIDVREFDFKDSKLRVIAFDQKGRVTEKEIFVKNNIHLLDTTIYYVFQNSSVALASTEYPAGYWTGEGSMQGGAFYPDTSEPREIILSYSTMVAGYDVTQEVIVRVRDIPQISLEKKDFCPGDSIRLKVPDMFHHYQWSNGHTTRATYVQEAGTYSVRAYDSLYGYFDTNITVSFTELPPTTIEFIAPNVLRSAEPCVTCLWTFADSLLLPQRSQTIKISRMGAYNLRTQDQNGCYSEPSESFLVDFPLLQQSVLRQSKLVVLYPNPTANTLNVEAAPTSQPYKIVIVNALGDPLFEKLYTAGEIPEPVNVSKWKSGTYLLLMNRAEGTAAERFTILR